MRRQRRRAARGDQRQVRVAAWQRGWRGASRRFARSDGGARKRQAVHAAAPRCAGCGERVEWWGGGSLAAGRPQCVVCDVWCVVCGCVRVGDTEGEARRGGGHPGGGLRERDARCGAAGSDQTGEHVCAVLHRGTPPKAVETHSRAGNTARAQHKQCARARAARRRRRALKFCVAGEVRRQPDKARAVGRRRDPDAGCGQRRRSKSDGARRRRGAARRGSAAARRRGGTTARAAACSSRRGGWACSCTYCHCDEGAASPCQAVLSGAARRR